MEQSASAGRSVRSPNRDAGGRKLVTIHLITSSKPYVESTPQGVLPPVSCILSILSVGQVLS